MFMWIFRSRLVQGLAVIAIWLMATFVWGKVQYRTGRADVVRKIEAARHDAVKQRGIINEEIRNLDADDLVGRASEWLRENASR